MLELDHLFCFVDPAGDWAARAQAAGYVLDEGIAHEGQGTRNRRLWFADAYLELLWIDRPEHAAHNPLRLDRRRCPFGIGLAGQLTAEQRAQFWVYEPPYAPGAQILIHHATEDQPFVFAFEATPEMRARYVPAQRRPTPPINAGRIERVRLRVPVDLQPILRDIVDVEIGEPRMELGVWGAPAVELSEQLALVGTW